MPRGGMCAEGAELGAGGCTWRNSPTVDVLYGARDLLPLGWNDDLKQYPKPGMNTTRVTLSNAVLFAEAWRRHDDEVGERCCGC